MFYALFPHGFTHKLGRLATLWQSLAAILSADMERTRSLSAAVPACSFCVHQVTSWQRLCRAAVSSLTARTLTLSAIKLVHSSD